MIISKQYNQELSVFDTKQLFHSRKSQLQSSVLETSAFRDRQEFKKRVIKRSSCHNICDNSASDNRQNESQQFSNKLLDHIFTQIKQNHKASLKQKVGGSIIHAMSQKNNEKTIQDEQELDRQNNLKIKSLNNLIKPKTESTHRNKTTNMPFQNKKLMDLRKGKSITLYTQQIEPQVTEPSNEPKILPWEFYNNHIIDLPGAARQIEDDTAQQHYLKSHNLKHKESKPFAKYNTLAFPSPQQRKPSFKKFSSIDVTRPEKPKPPTPTYNQIFSAHCMRERCNKQAGRNRHKNNSIKRTLTEMKMDIDEIQLQKQDQNLSNIKMDFFQCIIPKNILHRKPVINYHRPAQSFRRYSNQSVVNCFLIGRKL